MKATISILSPSARPASPQVARGTTSLVPLDRHPRRVDAHHRQQTRDGGAGVGLAQLAVDRKP